MSRRAGIFGRGALLLALACTPEVADDGVSNGATSGTAATHTGGYAGANLAGAGGAETQAGGGSGGAGSGPSMGGSAGPSGAGGSGSDHGGAGGSDVAGAGGSKHVEQGGSGGSDIIAQGGAGGSNQSGTGGSNVVEQGGAGGADVGQGGSDVGEGGSDQGGTGGSGIIEPEPECEGQFSRCNGTTYEECDLGVYLTYECTAETGLNCYPGGGCFGECIDGATRCTGDTAETCAHGEWTTREECPFQCVAGACEGDCTPGTVVCGDGASTVTCGSDFQSESPVACPTDPNGTASCSNGECDLQPIPCAPGRADCDSNWSCESDLSSLSSCGGCGSVCPNPANAAPTCSETTGCGFSCDDGFADCDGERSNGCEQNISTDALNCGACGVSCYGGSCSAGRCEYPFDVVADFSGATGTLIDMVVSGPSVYLWSFDNGTRTSRFERAATNGGDLELISSLPVVPHNTKDNVLLVNAGVLYAATETGIYRIPVDGSTATQLSTVEASTLAISNGKLYWNDSQSIYFGEMCLGNFYLNPTAFLDCNQRKVVTFYILDLQTLVQTTVWQTTRFEYSPVLGVIGNEIIVVQYQGAYPSRRGNNFYITAVVALDAATGAQTRLVAGSMVADGTTFAMGNDFGQAVFTADAMLYTTTLDGNLPIEPSLCRVPLNDPTPTLIKRGMLTTSVGPEYIASDGAHTYYTTASNVDRVETSGIVTHLFGAPGLQSKVAVDGAHVYWTVALADGQKAVLRTIPMSLPSL
jgi:hypothetical protein